jgi:indole-3-glycerol phosphate synthase
MTILDDILASKRRELAEAQSRRPRLDLERRARDLPPARPFRAALEQSADVAIIAEVKKASPSAGVLREDFDPVAIARVYAENGASALSVLTDTPFFQGRLEYLSEIREAVEVPLLRKDFILDSYQLLEARVAGADAALLIAEALPGDLLAELVAAARDIGLETLVELHDAGELPRVVASGARLIGVNNRDLRAFVTRLEQTESLAPAMPEGACLVSESGIRSAADIARLRAVGVRAVLVGESLMRAADIGAALRALRGVSH